jgi:hypothetical protein
MGLFFLTSGYHIHSGFLALIYLSLWGDSRPHVEQVFSRVRDPIDKVPLGEAGILGLDQRLPTSVKTRGGCEL